MGPGDVIDTVLWRQAVGRDLWEECAMKFQETAPTITDEHVKHWEMSPTTEDKNQVIEETLHYLQEQGQCRTPSIMFRYRLCMDEALTNSITHGCQGLENPVISVDLFCSLSSWSLRVSDPGPGFEGATVPDPTAPGQQFLEHGRGLLILERYCSDLVYSQGGREVTLTMEMEEVTS